MKREEKNNVEPSGETRQISIEAQTSDAKSGDLFPQRHESPLLVEIYATVITDQSEHIYSVPVGHESLHLVEIYATIRTVSLEHIYAVPLSSPNNTMTSAQVPRRKTHKKSGTRYEMYETSNVILYDRLQTSNLTSALPASISASHMTLAGRGRNPIAIEQCHDAEGYRARSEQPDSSNDLPEDLSCTVYTEIDTLYSEGTKYSQVASYNENTGDTPDTLYNKGTNYTQVASYNESTKDTICIALQFDSTISTQIASYYDTIHNNSVVTVRRSTYANSSDSAVPVRYPLSSSANQHWINSLDTSELEESSVTLRSTCCKDNRKVVKYSKRYRPNATCTLGKYDHRIDVENSFRKNVPFSSTMLSTPQRILSDDSAMSNIEENDLDTGLNHNQRVIRVLRGVSTAGTTTNITHGASILVVRSSVVSSLENDRTLKPRQNRRGRHTLFREHTRRRIDIDLDITRMNQAYERPAVEGMSFMETAQPATGSQYVQTATARPSQVTIQKAARGCSGRIMVVIARGTQVRVKKWCQMLLRVEANEHLEKSCDRSANM